MLESSGGYGATFEAFIFSLKNSEGLAPFVSKVTPGKAGKAIERNSYYGPNFGQDLFIHVEESRKSSSKAILGAYYPVPDSVRDKGSTILTGKHRGYFSPDEVEVFYLDPSP